VRSQRRGVGALGLNFRNISSPRSSHPKPNTETSAPHIPFTVQQPDQLFTAGQRGSGGGGTTHLPVALCFPQLLRAADSQHGGSTGTPGNDVQVEEPHGTGAYMGSGTLESSLPNTPESVVAGVAESLLAVVPTDGSVGTGSGAPTMSSPHPKMLSK
jgi:hypothetical protein